VKIPQVLVVVATNAVEALVRFHPAAVGKSARRVLAAPWR